MKPETINLADHRFDALPDPSSSLALIVAHAKHLAREAGDRASAPPTSSQFVRRVLAARVARRQFFTSDLFADPAWDMLLELYALQQEQRRTSISKLCIAAAVPATTALRWIEKLNHDGLITRTEDSLDARRVWISLSEKGFSAMRAYLEELGHGSCPI